MDIKRYSKLIQYKNELDRAWKRYNPVALYNTDYDITLQQAKLDEYKVLRNSKGEHKLIDKTNGDPSAVETFNELFGRIFNKQWRC